MPPELIPGALMSLSDLASLGAFVSGIAVVISFLFLAMQLRQANRNQRSLMQQGRSQRTVDLLTRMTDPRLGEVILRAFRADPTMNEGDYFVFYSFAAAVFWNYEDSFLQFQAGTLDARSWASDGSTLRQLLSNPAYRAAWRAASPGIGEGFREFMDGLVREVKGAAPRSISAVMSQFLSEEMQKAGLSAAGLPPVR